MPVTSSVWHHSSGVSVGRWPLNPQLAVKDSRNVQWEEGNRSSYKCHTLQLRCFLMALKLLSMGSLYVREPVPGLSSVNTILHAFVNREAKPSVRRYTTWFTSFVTLSKVVKSSVGILGVGFTFYFIKVRTKMRSDFCELCTGITIYNRKTICKRIINKGSIRNMNASHLLYWFTVTCTYIIYEITQVETGPVLSYSVDFWAFFGFRGGVL